MADSVCCQLASRHAAPNRPALAWRGAIVALGLAWALAAPAQTAPGADEASLRAILRAEAVALENGEGVERDPVRAASVYCEASRLGDATSQFNLGWMYANGRGVERSDANAAFFFHAAAEQGHEQAQRMLATVGGPPNYLPDCMREPAPVPPKAALAVTPRAAAGLARSQAPSAPPEVAGHVPPDVLALVKRLGPEYKVDPRLALAVIETESNYNPVALSPKNAKGLMQLIPETMARFGVRAPYDPAQNVRGGLAYLRWLLAYFEGDVLLVAAAYNAGEGAVNRYRGIPPYAETRLYVAKILTLSGLATHPFDARVVEPSPLLTSIRALRRTAR